MSVQNQILIPKGKNLLIGPDFQPHPLVESRTLQLVAWVVSGKNLLQRDYLKKHFKFSWRKKDSWCNQWGFDPI